MTDTNPDARGAGAEARDDAGQAASRVAEDARNVARQASERVRDEAYQQGDRAKEGVASEISGIADALRKAAGDMRSGSPQERTIGQLAGTLADASDAIRDRDLGEISSELSRFARRNPLAFLGGAALAGFAATRFAKASSNAPRGGYSGYSGAGETHGGEPYARQGSSAPTATPSRAPAPTAASAPSSPSGGIPGPATRPATTTSGTGSVSAPASTSTPYTTGER